VPVKLGMLVTHPIQYYAPLFRELASRTDCELLVFYCHYATREEQANAGFGVPFDWDVTLLDGYPYTFLKNVAAKPTTAGFWGLDVPEIADRISPRASALDALVIYGWHYKAAWQAMRACRRHGISVLLRSDSHLLNKRPRLISAGKRLVYPLFIRRADACLPAGQLAKQYFLYYGASPDRVFVIPHCIDDKKMSVASDHWSACRQSMRAAWRIEPSQIAWLFAGKFLEIKRPLEFVQLIAELQRNDSKSLGIMVGDGPLRETCEQYARDHQVPVRFPGFMNQSEIARAYTAADALVLPSRSETWGIVVNEAMACGLPCFVSTEVGCGPDLIEEGVTGAIVNFGDPAVAARKLQVYGDHETLRRMGSAARSHARRFSVQFAAESLLAAVNTTVRRAGRTLTVTSCLTHQ
jgi:glycosyltransferase involved in cell wall biosynthesis